SLPPLFVSNSQPIPNQFSDDTQGQLCAYACTHGPHGERDNGFIESVPDREHLISSAGGRVECDCGRCPARTRDTARIFAPLAAQAPPGCRRTAPARRSKSICGRGGGGFLMAKLRNRLAKALTDRGKFALQPREALGGPTRRRKVQQKGTPEHQGERRSGPPP